ncbi:MAG: excisionase family DNA-binding protein [Methylobacterium radiotolerans]
MPRGGLPFPPKGLSRMEAARYVGVSAPTFDAMVRDRRMPSPKVVGSRVLWDRLKLDAYFDALPERDAEADESGDSWADFR